MILGIESSCDESSIAILDYNGQIIFHEVYSQDNHKEFNGIVPEIASREHFKKIPLLLTNITEYLPSLTGVCATNEPGLLGPLLVGLTAGKTIAYSMDIPFYPINHLHAHYCSPLIEHREELTFPYISILLSGGHSQIVIVKSFDQFEIISKTKDDACGEAFDKGAVCLGLGYPGAKKLDDLANDGKEIFEFKPSFWREKSEVDFSFSGHKSALKRFYQKHESQFSIEDYCYSYRKCLIDEVLHKVKRVLEIYPNTKNIPWTLAGGVASNMSLRAQLKQILPSLYVPSPIYCTDNGAMIAFLGLQKHLVKHKSNLYALASPN